MGWEAVIGLEVHAQLATCSKLFCGCPTTFGAAPNTQVCPVCLGHPGVLPVANRRAVELAVRMGLAVGAAIRSVSVFERKNYFYPDLPKNYQISQFQHPLCEGGGLSIPAETGERWIRLRRIHLEEDAGKSKHPERPGETRSRIDLNRCGVPLIEIVSEPDMRSPREAHAFLTRLHRLVVWLGVSDGNMEEGSLRCDANVSVRPQGVTELATRTELKNLNSFRFVEKALAFEIERQTALLESGGRVEQATLLWDPDAGRTHPMRGKEEAHDYRYFPDPDLPHLVVGAAWLEEVRRELPELPEARQSRWRETFDLPNADTELLTQEKGTADYFEAAVRAGAPAKAAANWISTELLGRLRERGIDASDAPVDAGDLAWLLQGIGEGRLSGRQAKEVFEEAFTTGRSLRHIVEERGIEQVSDQQELARWIEEVLDAHPEQVAEFLRGKDAVARFLTGQVMRLSRGRANPAALADLLTRALERRRP